MRRIILENWYTRFLHSPFVCEILIASPRSSLDESDEWYQSGTSAGQGMDG